MKSMKINKEKLEELRDGRKNNVLAEMLGVSPQHLSNVFSGRYEFSKQLALLLISMKERIPVNDRKMPEWIKYYFEEK